MSMSTSDLVTNFPRYALGVIAGGRSSRWGKSESKCLSAFRGQAMIASALNQLSLPVHAVCIRPEQYPAWQAAKLPYLIVQESRPDLPEGPLKGIHCLLSSLGERQQLIILPCDMPLLTDQVIEVLWKKQQEIGEDYPLLLTEASGKHTPVCLLSQRQLTSLESYLLTGEQKLIRWLEKEGVIAVPWLGDQALLQNMNYAEDALTYENR
jgi:molybdopterin-guanine dinucleotide biosynthesis protein A